MPIDLKKRAQEALQQGHLMSLGTVDGEGVWVADVIYIFDENFNIYWMSSPNARHSKAIELNGKVAASITVSTKSKENNFGLQFEGKAQKLDQLDYAIAKQHLSKRGHSAPDEPTNILKEGSYWYMLVPTALYLIDEKNFGFKRQAVSIS